VNQAQSEAQKNHLVTRWFLRGGGCWPQRLNHQLPYWGMFYLAL